MSRFVLIETDSALHDFLHQIDAATRIMLDTEFIREKTYYPKACLIQVAGDEQIACIDPLALQDLEPLWEFLADTKRTKVFHAGRQDMEIIYQASGRLPGPVFDTQVAAALCGYGDQVGYANLVREVLGVDLDKSMTRADWSARPLPQDALTYAADDVRYLAAVDTHLRERFEQLKRTHWLEPEMAALTDPVTYDANPAEAWRRIRGARRLKPAQVAVLQALAAWRETEAMQRNRPRKWILKDDALVFMAQRPPSSIAAISSVRGIEERDVERHGEAILKAIESANDAAPPDNLPVDKERLTPAQEAQVDLLMAVLRHAAAEAELSPASIGTRKDLERLLRGEMKLDILSGWRRAAVGDQLLAVLAGKQAVRCEGDRIVVGDGGG
jgi:ribonuclease D